MNSIPVFYRPEMSVESHGYSPSASKPQFVVDDWQASGLSIVVRSFEPATIADLCLAHDSDHVSNILEGRTSNGHGNAILEVSRSCLLTVGSFVAAADEALRNGKVACSPTSGFHHAGYDSCRGYCTFNGLMVAARKMIHRDVAVAIIDCDAHYGDGTNEIIERLDVAKHVSHWTYGRDMDRAFEWNGFESQIEAFFRDFDERSTPSNRILFYQAGADVHVDDPLGPGEFNGMSDDVTVVDVAGAKAVKSIPVGRVPYGVVIVE